MESELERVEGGFGIAPKEHFNQLRKLLPELRGLAILDNDGRARQDSGDQSLLVCCAAFHGVTAAKASERWPNLTLKKIPKMVLTRCEWGHDDYSLNVANLPMAQVEKHEPAAAAGITKKSKKSAPASAGQGGLFGGNE